MIYLNASQNHADELKRFIPLISVIYLLIEIPRQHFTNCDAILDGYIQLYLRGRVHHMLNTLLLDIAMCSFSL